MGLALTVFGGERESFVTGYGFETMTGYGILGKKIMTHR